MCDSDGGLYNYFIPGAIRALYCVPEHRPSIVVNPMRLMLLMMVPFGAAPQMITLPTKVAMAFAYVDAISFGEIVKICAARTTEYLGGTIALYNVTCRSKVAKR